MPGKVSVVIRNWNGIKYLDECFKSLENQTYPNFEVIFVDDGSTDGSVEFVQQNFPNVKIITNEKPDLGSAECSNIGIRASDGEYVAILDVDAVARPDWLENLVNEMETDHNIGMCASKLLRYHNHRILDYAGTLVYKDFSFIARGLNEIDRGQYDKKEVIFGPMAAAALYRRKMLDEIEMFDKDYYTYPDDFDIAWRGLIAGWKCIFVPTAIAYHVHSAIGGSGSPRKAYYHEKNRILCMLKNAPLDMIILSIPFTIRRYISLANSLKLKKGSGARVMRSAGRVGIIKLLLKAWFNAFLEIPRELKKRRVVQSTKKISDEEMKRFFKTFSASVYDVVYKVDHIESE